MPDSLFNEKDGFSRSDAPEVGAPDPGHSSLTKPPKSPRNMRWTLSLLGFAILAAVGLGGAFVAWPVMKAV
jgi:hypothetical protein